MVMDEPSPQCVGQEFVRQYYTMLHEAPAFMHRFYSHDSSFVHGGIEKPGEELPPVMGQQAIHKKILSLNFNDCHAKIRQVDSQGTVDHAVVVQVAGELSNNGQPMRRFMQTFVLAPQSPKKYYVYNDIFRYQDEVFNDGCGGDSEADIESDNIDSYAGNSSGHEQVYQEQDHQQPIRAADVILEEQQRLASYAVEPSAPTAILHPAPMGPPPGLEDTDKKPLFHAKPAAEIITKQIPISESHHASTVGSAGGDPGADHLIASQVPHSPRSATPVAPQSAVDLRTSVMAAATPVIASNVASAPAVIKDEQEIHDVDSGPKPAVSWAERASKNPGGSVSAATPSPKPQATVKPELKPESVNAMPAPLPQRIPPRRDRGSMDRRPGSPPPEHDVGGDSDDRNRLPVYPDEQQLFVGNLPHSATNEELKEFFGQFGPVIDVRINRKGVQRDVPNFGFITFDSVEPVHKVLAARPLYLGSKHRLNIEEKKPPSEFGSSGMRGGGQRGGFRGYAPGRGGGVVSFRGGRGTWRGRPRGSSSYNSYRTNDDGNGSGGEVGDYSSAS